MQWQTGKVLFTDIILWDIRTQYHTNDFSYGILPIPKMEDTQERYYNICFWPYQTTHLWMIPRVCHDADKASLLFHVLTVHSALR